MMSACKIAFRGNPGKTSPSILQNLVFQHCPLHGRHVFLFVISSFCPLPHISFPNASQCNNSVFLLLLFLLLDSTSCFPPSFIPNPHQLPHHYPSSTTLEPKDFHMVGFNHRAGLPLGRQVIKAVQSGAFSRIVLVGGCYSLPWDQK